MKSRVFTVMLIVVLLLSTVLISSISARPWRKVPVPGRSLLGAPQASGRRAKARMRFSSPN